ncbi:unnamed protein product [Phytophthora fragariaefolia]|uniref:Unnamed protein product n=1 Tax=Phytophthora fragariaefolia TaxID=1490495 RepID=A0A9W6TNC2_9STRA|nr:unnamed protein product [Phytophthora fragariaefolia]
MLLRSWMVVFGGSIVVAKPKLHLFDGSCSKAFLYSWSRLHPAVVEARALRLSVDLQHVGRKVCQGIAGARKLITDGTHFVAIIASNKFLLCCSTLEDESDLDADATIALLDDILDTYAIDATQLCFYICDHAAVNVTIAKKNSSPDD